MLYKYKYIKYIIYIHSKTLLNLKSENILYFKFYFIKNYEKFIVKTFL